MYCPIIKSAKTTKEYHFDKCRAFFLEEIISNGVISYEFIIVVIEQDATDPFLFVTSERKRNSLARSKLFESMGIEPADFPSHYLCLFDEYGHNNFGDLNDWSNREKFESEALRILEHRLGTKPIAV